MLFCHLPGGQGNSTHVIPKRTRTREKIERESIRDTGRKIYQKAYMEVGESSHGDRNRRKKEETREEGNCPQ
jgi:hypothetical protein